MTMHREIELKLELAPEDAHLLRPVPCARSEPSKSKRADIHINMTAADGFAAIAISCLQHFRLNEAVFLDRRPIEALHQLRVATRRLRSAFDLFRPILRQSRCYRRQRKEWRRLGRRLGEARNFDVAISLVDADCVDVERLKLAREESYDRVRDILNSHRFHNMVSELVRWLSIGKWRTRTTAGLPLASFSAWRVDKAWAQLSAEKTPLSKMSDRQRHRFRIRIKKLRYILDFLRALHRGPKDERKSFRASMEAIQDTLGILNDVSIAERMGALTNCSIQQGSDPAVTLAMAESHRSKLMAIGPYWRNTA